MGDWSWDGGDLVLDYLGDQDVTCTFTNTYTPPPPPAKLTIVKKTIGGADGTFAFTGDLGNFSITTDGYSESETFTNVAPGSYTSTEDLSGLGDEWSFVSASCETSIQPLSDVPSVTAVLESWDEVVCTFVNKYTPHGSLTIEKKTIYPDQSTGPDGTFNFTKGNQTHDPFSITTVNGIGTYGPDELDAGNYSFTEIAPSDPGWSISDITCDAENYKADVDGGTATVHLAQGEHVTCTVTNVYTPSSLILMKVVNGGTSVPEDWTLTARDGDGNTVAEGPGIAGPVQVPSGIYTLSESADFAGSDAYASSGWVCAEQVVAATDDLVVADPGPALLPNQVKIEPGDSWVCMVENTYAPPPPPPPPPHPGTKKRQPREARRKHTAQRTERKPILERMILVISITSS